MLGPAHDLAQLLHLSALLVSAQFGIANDVDEKNMGDFQPEFRFLFVRHWGMNLGGSGKALYIIFHGREDGVSDIEDSGADWQLARKE